MSVLRWQQKDGLDTVLPYGLQNPSHPYPDHRKHRCADSFRAQEIMQTEGIYYGQNAVSKNMIVADRRKLLNGNSFRLVCFRFRQILQCQRRNCEHCAVNQ